MRRIALGSQSSTGPSVVSEQMWGAGTEHIFHASERASAALGDHRFLGPWEPNVATPLERRLLATLKSALMRLFHTPAELLGLIRHQSIQYMWSEGINVTLSFLYSSRLCCLSLPSLTPQKSAVVVAAATINNNSPGKILAFGQFTAAFDTLTEMFTHFESCQRICMCCQTFLIQIWI